jgi:Pyruvate/2-oxoacid:ferredoxin oxidoreductase delta subunit
MANWDSLYIYYITGTGNAKAASNWIADEAGKRGIKNVVMQIDKNEEMQTPVDGEKALIGFAFPTHGFNAAPIMLKFIAGFPRGLSKEVFLLNTRAGMKLSKLFLPGLSGMALLLPAFFLWMKGYKVIGYRPVDLPSNWIPLHPGIKEKIIESIFTRCEKLVRSFADKLFKGEKVYNGLYTTPIDLLISPVALGYYVGGRFFLAKTFIANYNCNNCGICIKDCPTSSIKYVANRPYWMLTCESCMRCLNRCPQKAIEAAHGMALLFWFIFSTLNAAIFTFIIKSFGIDTHDLWWIITVNIAGIGGMVLFTTLLYLLFHYLMGLKPIRYLVTFTSLTVLPFWRRYGIRKRK